MTKPVLIRTSRSLASLSMRPLSNPSLTTPDIHQFISGLWHRKSCANHTGQPFIALDLETVLRTILINDQIVYDLSIR